MSVSANNDWLGPSWYKSRNVLADDRFSEYSTIEDIPDCTVRGFPHLLESELFYSILIWGNGCTLNTNFVLLDSVG
jgi:hypothetical protein